MQSVVPAWTRSYQRAWLGPDAITGVSTAAVVIPQSMAYATIAALTAVAVADVAGGDADMPVVGRKPGTSVWQDLERHPGGETLAGVLVVRVIGPVYFANAQTVRRRLMATIDAAEDPPRLLVLDTSSVSDVDTTALAVVADLDRDLGERGITLILAGDNERPIALLRRMDIYDRLERRVFEHIEDAVRDA